MRKLTLKIIFIFAVILINCEEQNEEFEDFHHDYQYYDRYDYDEYFGKKKNINILSISYELAYSNTSIVKVVLKTYEEITNDLNFRAYLKSDEEEKSYPLKCSNTVLETIECYSERNIILNLEDKYYFYYQKAKIENLTLDGRETIEDDDKISLVFKPEIPESLKLYKDNRKITVRTNREMVGGGFLYLVRKSKEVLKKPKDGFNKYIELNNYIGEAGLGGLRPPSTIVSYEEAIRRGYHMVDAHIQFTKDKTPVIYHMKNIDENSDGIGDIPSKTIDELSKLDFGSKFNEIYKGEKILIFEDLLQLCKENNIIIELNLTLIDYQKYFNETNEYFSTILNLINKYEMLDSILFTDNRPEVISKLKVLKDDISISFNGDGNNDKLKSIPKDDKNRLIYTMNANENERDENGRNEKNDNGLNYLKTNKLHPFLIKNSKEEPIIVRCSPSEEYDIYSDCEIDENIRLIDNEIYNIYYSDNIYNISEDINDHPIGEFEYLDTNILEELYYSIVNLNFEEGFIILNTSNKVKKDEQIIGVVGPAFDNVAECYQYKFICKGNNTHKVKCEIEKDDKNKVKYNGKYSIYSLEGYSLNPEKIAKKLFNKKVYKQFYFYILIGIFVLIIIFLIFCIIKKRKKDVFGEMKISGNVYMSDDNLYK